jgi:hypothetical protein
MRLNRVLRGWLARQLGGAICALACGLGVAEAANTGFVHAQGDRFVLNGSTFYFVGTNAYYMAIMTALGSRRHADDQLALAQILGFTVMRMWGYADGPNEGMGGNAFQTGPGVYNEASFRALDYVLYKADLAGVRLLIPLVDGNSSYGGVNQYVAWCAPGGGERAFYENPACKQLYENYVSFVLNRVNTYNGRRYKGERSTGEWFIRRSSDGGLLQVAWGSPFLDDVPVPGRFTNPRGADITVYRRSTGEWFIRRGADGDLTYFAWGSPPHGDSPVPADYDGDRLADPAVYRETTGEWFIARSGGGGLWLLAWGAPAHRDLPVPADYDGDRRADVAVYRQVTGEWFIRRSSDGGLIVLAWGAPAHGDSPIPGSFESAGRADVAVYRTTTGQWLIRHSSNGALPSVGWGAPAQADVPLR